MNEDQEGPGPRTAAPSRALPCSLQSHLAAIKKEVSGPPTSEEQKRAWSLRTAGPALLRGLWGLVAGEEPAFGEPHLSPRHARKRLCPGHAG